MEGAGGGDADLLELHAVVLGADRATQRLVQGVRREYAEKGVTFEHYDMPGAKHDGDVHDFGKLRVAWFKDPDGNIFNLGNF